MGHNITDTKNEFDRVKESVDLQIQSRGSQLRSDRKFESL